MTDAAAPLSGSLRAANVLALVAVLVVDALAGTGALSGESIGTVANDYPSLFLPADYTFGIWSLIYLALTGFAVYQATPRGARSSAVNAIGGLWIVTCALNIAWAVSFTFRLFAVALVCMVALLAALAVLDERVRRSARTEPMERLLVVHPFTLYLAWICVALVSNTFQYAAFREWKGLGLPERAWAVGMMAVVTAVGLSMLVRKRAWLFPLVVAWALVGIGIRYTDLTLIAWPAFGLASIGVLAVLGRGVARTT